MHEVSAKEWDKMKSRNDHRHYKVIDDSDSTMVSEKISVVELINDDIAEPNKELEHGFEEDEEIEFLREQLTLAGKYFHPNTGIAKLRKLYGEI